MIDLRYLVVSLTGVFLALAVGMLIGSALGGPDKRDAAYEALRGQFDELRSDNQRVHDENDQVRRRLSAREQAIQDLLPVAAHNRLDGSTIGVIICGSGGERSYWSDLESAVRSAGGQIGAVIRIPDQLQAIPDAERVRFAALWQPDSHTGNDPFEPAGWLVHGLCRSGTNSRIDDLVRATGMDLRARSAAQVRRLLVLTSVKDDQRASLVDSGQIPELAVVDAARAEGIRVVAAEPEVVQQSVVESLRRRGIPTVDNVDTALGQLSAVLALSGDADGQFGSKPGATRALPPLSSH